MITIKQTNIKQGIAYQRPILTGETVSFATYDDVWQQINNPYPLAPINPVSVAQLDTFDLLVDNNSFGNKNRFTDINGLQVYADNYIIDHLTGLGWSKHFIVQSGDWAATMATINAFTNAGFTDWRLTNSTELESIAKYNDYDAFVYTPFLQNANRTLITSTSSYRNTALYIRSYVTYVGGYSATSTAKTSATLYYMICRNHF